MNRRYTNIGNVGSYSAYYRTPSNEINDCIDDIRINANAMIIEKCHGKEWVLEDSDSQLLAAIEDATLKIIKAVEKWENKTYGSCCDAPEAKYGDAKTYPPYLDHEKC